MRKETLVIYLKSVGMRHTAIMPFWAELMNETGGKVAGWLVENGYKELRDLNPFLRQNQVAITAEEIENETAAI